MPSPGMSGLLATVFGQVSVSRIAYRAKGVDSRYPADAVLNLPAGKHSHGLARPAGEQAASGSLEQSPDGHRAGHRGVGR